jgi:hypothetical protein
MAESKLSLILEGMVRLIIHRHSVIALAEIDDKRPL